MWFEPQQRAYAQALDMVAAEAPVLGLCRNDADDLVAGASRPARRQVAISLNFLRRMLRRMLNKMEPIGSGHEQASGGALQLEQGRTFVERLGFWA